MQLSKPAFAWACAFTAGVVLLSSAVAACAQGRPERQVALTFDDLPYAGAIGAGPGQLPRAHVLALNQRVLEELRHAGAPATGFVVERTLEAMADDGRTLLSLWTQDAFALGNHGYAHADINQLSLAEIADEIAKGEASIAPLMALVGKPLRFMRFPKNHTGDTEAKRDGVARLLSARGYTAAASTIDTSDYVFEAAYQVALSADDEDCAARVRDAYVTYSAIQIEYYSTLSAEVLGYAPPEIALLHLNQINADTMPRLLGLYRDRGFTFISLEQAQADPAYRSPASFVSSHGPMWAYRWARERGIRIDGTKELEPPEWLSTYAVGETQCLFDPEANPQSEDRLARNLIPNFPHGEHP